MTDKKMYKLLTDFANKHALSEGVDVNVSSMGKTFTAQNEEGGGKYEYIELLADMLRGAEHFLLWARRNKVNLS